MKALFISEDGDLSQKDLPDTDESQPFDEDTLTDLVDGGLVVVRFHDGQFEAAMASSEEVGEEGGDEDVEAETHTEYSFDGWSKI